MMLPSVEVMQAKIRGLGAEPTFTEYTDNYQKLTFVCADPECNNVGVAT